MTLAAADRVGAPALARPIREAFRREPLFATAALVLALFSLPMIVALALDDRTLLGVNVWIKPLKFALALFVYLATLAWFAGWLPPGVTRNRWYLWFSAAVVLAIAAEMVWIGGAAVGGVASHFNQSTPLMAALYPLMGVVAIFLTSATLVYAVLIWRHKDGPLDPVFRLSVSLGLAMTFLLTVPVASHLASGSGHAVGGSGSDADGLMLFGWARDGGDLRVAHFFATHAMQFVPAFGFLAARALPPRAGRPAVVVFAAAFAGFVFYTLFQATQGRPFFALAG